MELLFFGALRLETPHGTLQQRAPAVLAGWRRLAQAAVWTLVAGVRWLFRVVQLGLRSASRDFVRAVEPDCGVVVPQNEIELRTPAQSGSVE